MESISVSVRVRPPNQAELKDRLGQTIPWHFEHNLIAQTDEKGRVVRSFPFDNVFKGAAANEEVYKTVAQHIVHSVAQGFNGTIFCYGQTGSGKTHTMMGVRDSAHQQGIVPLAMRELFDLVVQQQNREWLIRMQFLEIYNETIRDLLDDGKPRELRESIDNGDKRVVVENAVEVVLTSLDQVFDKLQEGNQRRHVRATKMNEASSRSHSIFRVFVESRERAQGGEGEPDGAVRTGVLNLVDLAGSERADKSGTLNNAASLREGCNINQSLFTLSRCIEKLADGVSAKGGHVPYRDSKLTRMLEHSLGGNSKTAIVCTISPSARNLDESLSTLSFASRAKKIKNNATINEFMDDRSMMKKLQREVHELRSKLAEAESAGKKQQEEERLRQEVAAKEAANDEMAKANAAMTARLEEELATRRALTQKLEVMRTIVEFNRSVGTGLAHAETAGGESGVEAAAERKQKRHRRMTWSGAKEPSGPLQPLPPLPDFSRLRPSAASQARPSESDGGGRRGRGRAAPAGRSRKRPAMDAIAEDDGEEGEEEDEEGGGEGRDPYSYVSERRGRRRGERRGTGSSGSSGDRSGGSESFVDGDDWARRGEESGAGEAAAAAAAAELERAREEAAGLARALEEERGLRAAQAAEADRLRAEADAARAELARAAQEAARLRREAEEERRRRAAAEENARAAAEAEAELVVQRGAAAQLLARLREVECADAELHSGLARAEELEEERSRLLRDLSEGAAALRAAREAAAAAEARAEAAEAEREAAAAGRDAMLGDLREAQLQLGRRLCGGPRGAPRGPRRRRAEAARGALAEREREAEAAREEAAGLRRELNKAASTRREADAALATAEREAKAVAKERGKAQEVQDKLRAALQEKTQAQGEKAQLEREVKELRKQLAAAEREALRSAEASQRGAAKGEAKARQAAAAAAEAELEALRQANAALAEARGAAEAAAGEARAELEAARAELEAARGELEAARSEAEAARSEARGARELERQHEAVCGQLTELEFAHAEEKAEWEAASAELARGREGAERAAEAAGEEAAALRREAQRAERARREAAEEADELRRQLADAREALRVAEAERRLAEEAAAAAAAASAEGGAAAVAAARPAEEGYDEEERDAAAAAAEADELRRRLAGAERAAREAAARAEALEGRARALEEEAASASAAAAAPLEAKASLRKAEQQAARYRRERDEARGQLAGAGAPPPPASPAGGPEGEREGEADRLRRELQLRDYEIQQLRAKLAERARRDKRERELEKYAKLQGAAGGDENAAQPRFSALDFDRKPTASAPAWIAEELQQKAAKAAPAAPGQMAPPPARAPLRPTGENRPAA
eukprot:tig00000955_g5797.t1